MAWFRGKNIRIGEAISLDSNEKSGVHYYCGISNTSKKTVQFGYGLFCADEDFWCQSYTMARKFGAYGL